MESGDRVLFVTDEAGNVRLTSAKALIHAVWANNHGGDGGDSGKDVRRMRDNDQPVDVLLRVDAGEGLMRKRHASDFGISELNLDDPDSHETLVVSISST